MMLRYMRACARQRYEVPRYGAMREYHARCKVADAYL